MNKQNETQNTETNKETDETIEAVELENVIGGCANCGCGQPAASGVNFAAQFGANFRR